MVKDAERERKTPRVREAQLQGGDITRPRQRDVDQCPERRISARYREPSPANAFDDHDLLDVERVSIISTKAVPVPLLIARICKEIIRITTHHEDGAEQFCRQAMDEAWMWC